MISIVQPRILSLQILAVSEKQKLIGHILLELNNEGKSRWCLLQNLFYRQPVYLIMPSLKSCDGIVEVLLCNVQSPLSFRTKTFQRVTNVLI